MGTPAFAVPSLAKLYEAGHDISLVVTQPDRPGNRGKVIMSPVKSFAVEHGLAVSQPERLRRDHAAVEQIRACSPDMIVVAAFGQILPKDVLDIPRYGCINVHGSLLPKYRGASPMHCAILNGETVTGVTIMRMEEGLDTGDMISSAELDITGKDLLQVSSELSDLGADLLIQTIREIEQGTAVYTKQDDALSTYAPMIHKADGLTDFSEPAEVLERKARAFIEWPTLHSYLGGQIVKFYKVSATEYGSSDAEPGTILEINNNNFIVKCGKGALVIQEVQMQGKRRMSAGDFLRGSHLRIGDRFDSL